MITHLSCHSSLTLLFSKFMLAQIHFQKLKSLDGSLSYRHQSHVRTFSLSNDLRTVWNSLLRSFIQCRLIFKILPLRHSALRFRYRYIKIPPHVKGIATLLFRRRNGSPRATNVVAVSTKAL